MPIRRQFARAQRGYRHTATVIAGAPVATVVRRAAWIVTVALVLWIAILLALALAVAALTAALDTTAATIQRDETIVTVATVMLAAVGTWAVGHTLARLVVRPMIPTTGSANPVIVTRAVTLAAGWSAGALLMIVLSLASGATPLVVLVTLAVAAWFLFEGAALATTTRRRPLPADSQVADIHLLPIPSPARSRRSGRRMNIRTLTAATVAGATLIVLLAGCAPETHGDPTPRPWAVSSLARIDGATEFTEDGVTLLVPDDMKAVAQRISDDVTQVIVLAEGQSYPALLVTIDESDRNLEDDDVTVRLASVTEQLSVESKTTEATLKSDDVTWAGVPFARGARGTISDPKGDTSRRVGVVVLRNETSSKLVTVQVNTPERTLEGSAAFDVLRTVKVAG